MTRSMACGAVFGAKILIGAGPHGTIVTIDSQVYGAASVRHAGPRCTQQSARRHGHRHPLAQEAARVAGRHAPDHQRRYYSGWNFQGYPGSANWVWSYQIVDDATSIILKDGYRTNPQTGADSEVRQ